MNELLNKLQRYIKTYKEPPYGEEVEIAVSQWLKHEEGEI